MCESKIKLKEKDIAKIKEICNFFDNKEGELISVLHRCQGEFGYLPPQIQDVVSDLMNIPVAKIYGVVTFYSFFTMKPKGKYPISVCTGTACYVRGAENVMDEFKKELNLKVGETSADGKFSLSGLRCVGACGLAPVVLVGEKVYGRVSPDGVKEILAAYDD